MSLEKLTPKNYRKGLIKEADALIVKAKDINPIIDILNGLSALVPTSGGFDVTGDISASGQVSAEIFEVQKYSVTQATSISTGVTITAGGGTIITVATTLAAGASASSFTVTNNFVKSTSLIFTSCLQGASGSAVVANVSNITNGSFDITLTNAGGTTTGSAAVTIQFLVI